MELHDMMARWDDQEDEENDRFPKCNHNKQSIGNGTSTRASGTTQEYPKAQAKPRSHSCRAESMWQEVGEQ
jgi:hypothetical protein